MRTRINLSRRPFTNHRIFWIAVVAVGFTSLWLLLWIGAEKGRVMAKAERTRQRIEDQKALAEDARREIERRKQAEQKIVVTDQQKMQLASARLLIQRKRFSWNKMIGDIEDFVPKNTRIMTIKVDEIANTGEDVIARIMIKAIGTTPGEMTEMMESLEKSRGVFTVVGTGQEATTEAGETPFTLNLTYKPVRGGDR
jgi:hypothetical protein